MRWEAHQKQCKEKNATEGADRLTRPLSLPIPAVSNRYVLDSVEDHSKDRDRREDEVEFGPGGIETLDLGEAVG